MNLYDLVKRNDRSVDIISGSVESVIYEFNGHKMHAVKLGKRACLCLNDAHEFYVFRTFPRVPGWKVITNCSSEEKNNVFEIRIESLSDSKETASLFKASIASKTVTNDVVFNWPIFSRLDDGYRIVITNYSDEDVHLCSGYAFNPRQKILPLIKGNGVEVGPGLNPHILPTQDVSVRYIETMPAEEWMAIYQKKDKPDNKTTDNLWSNYIVSDARELEEIENESLDFIFSNHVFEHLVNPIQVLRNWLAKLKPNGVIVGAVPDCRYTFDLRQQPSTISELQEEYQSNINSIEMPKYERWCKYTAPYNNPESLIERNYSIHVHYYTPESFSSLIGILKNDNLVKNSFYNVSPNNKDFGFVIQKSGVVK